MTRTHPFTTLLLVLGLAACRGEDPDQAPPIGRAEDAPVPAAAAPAIADEPVLVPSMLALDVAERSRRYRQAAAEARHQLDVAWNRCGSLDGDPFVRCRDEAVVTYDQAMTRARAMYGDDIEDRGVLVPGTLHNPGEIAAVQVTGIRG